jgi:hypothetical protein
VRTVMSLLLALIASFASGALVLQLIVQAARGDEVYIVAFFWLPVAVGLCLVVLGLAGALARSVGAVDRTALLLGALATAAGIGLLVWSLAAGGAGLGREGPLIAAFVLPTWMVIATQWWFLRRHRARVAEQGAQ